MQIYLAGTDVHANMQFTDRDGNQLSVISVQYQVTDNYGNELLPLVDLPYSPSQGGVDVIVPASINRIALPDLSGLLAEDMGGVMLRELRTIEFYLTLEDNNVIHQTLSYALEPTEVLIVGLNSFQTLKQAELVALDVPGMAGWNGASDQDKIAAMVEARLRICRLRFNGFSRGQSYLSEYASIGDLALVPPSEFVNLPLRLLAALAKAQVVEANSILGADPIELKRRAGLVSETIGESSETYRAGKAIELSVSKESLRYLSAFISFSKGIGRT